MTRKSAPDLVTMFLMNGYQLRGIITGFDAFTVVLTTDGRQQVIYKHAISTITPGSRCRCGRRSAEAGAVGNPPKGILAQ